MDYKNHFNYDSDINYEEEEDRVDIEFDPSLPLNLPIQSNKPQQIITPESLEKHQGKTIKEVFDSLIPNYRTNEEIVSNISGNNLEFKKKKVLIIHMKIHHISLCIRKIDFINIKKKQYNK